MGVECGQCVVAGLCGVVEGVVGELWGFAGGLGRVGYSNVVARAKRELAVESMHELWNDPPSSHNEGAVSGSAEILIVGVPGWASMQLFIFGCCTKRMPSWEAPGWVQ